MHDRRLRHPVPRHHRGSRQQLCPRQRQDHGLLLLWRLRRASRRRQRRRRHRHLPLLRLSAGQGHQLGSYTFAAACRKAARAINEVACARRQDQHPLRHQHSGPPRPSSAGQCHTKFIDETPELFDIDWTPATGPPACCEYIAEIQVANPNAERAPVRHSPLPRSLQHAPLKCPGLKQLLDEKGPEAVRQWVLEQKKLLLTDTTMRDAHQSLLSTRMRTRDMVKGADGVADILRRLLLPGDVGRRYLRRGLPLPPRVPMGAAAAAAGEDPQHPFPDAAAWLQSGGLCQLSRQPGPQPLSRRRRSGASTCSVCSTL